METITFYSLSFCLSKRVRHDQIFWCTVVIYPNNFKCHGTIFVIFGPQKTHYFLERTHQILTPSNVFATRCRLLLVVALVDAFHPMIVEFPRARSPSNLNDCLVPLIWYFDKIIHVPSWCFAMFRYPWAISMGCIEASQTENTACHIHIKCSQQII